MAYELFKYPKVPVIYERIIDDLRALELFTEIEEEVRVLRTRHF